MSMGFEDLCFIFEDMAFSPRGKTNGIIVSKDNFQLENSVGCGRKQVAGKRSHGGSDAYLYFIMQHN